MYTAYRKAGYSKALLEAHREKITLHKAAKAAFDEAGLQKLPKVKELDAEFSELLTKEESRLPGLPQGTERDAGTGSGTEKCRTFFCRGKEHHRENTDTLKKSPRSFPSWEAASADFLVYRAALRSNAPVTRIFSPRSFRVLRRAGACTKGSGIYTVRRQHKRLPGSFSPQYRRCTVQCVPGPCRFARLAPSD